MTNGTCPKCNAALTTDLKVCPGCGAAIEAAPAPAAAPAAPAKTSRSFGVGDMMIGLGSFMCGVSGLIFVIATIDHMDTFYLGLGLMTTFALMISPVVPLGATFMSLKNPSLLKVNYFYAGFMWLMKFTGVSIMVAASQHLTKFVQCLDFWLLLGATFIAAGACMASCKAKSCS